MFHSFKMLGPADMYQDTKTASRMAPPGRPDFPSSTQELSKAKGRYASKVTSASRGATIIVPA